MPQRHRATAPAAARCQRRAAAAGMRVVTSLSNSPADAAAAAKSADVTLIVAGTTSGEPQSTHLLQARREKGEVRS